MHTSKDLHERFIDERFDLIEVQRSVNHDEFSLFWIIPLSYNDFEILCVKNINNEECMEEIVIALQQGRRSIS